MELFAKVGVLMICCLLINNVKAKSSKDVYRELEEALEVLEKEEEERSEDGLMEDDDFSDYNSLEDDEVDINTRGSNTNRFFRQAARIAISEAKVMLEDEFLIRNRHFQSGIDRPPGQLLTAASMAGLNDIPQGTEGEREENRTLIALFALQNLQKKLSTPLSEILTTRVIQNVFSAEEGDRCRRRRPVCNLICRILDPRFRTINGTCNNKRSPRLGSAGEAQARLLDAEYEDGIGSVRTTGKNSNPLPNPRTVSRIVLRNESDLLTPDDPERSVFVTVWGQFLDHDITETPMTKGREDTTVGCCSLTEAERAERTTQCAAFEIESGDPTFTRNCMDLVRSLPTRANPCVPGVREQINAITAYIDGSQVYGSEEELAHELRQFKDGLLKVEGDNLLPSNDDSACLLTDPADHCLLAGDVRVNENPHLGAIHIAFVRYHNILAKQFKDSGLTDDEEIYQKTRKIIGAIMQHETYAGWLPNVLGETTMMEFSLTLDDQDPYNESVDPSIKNAFSSAALRYGHSLISQTFVQLDDSFIETSDSDELENHFFRPDMFSDRTQLENLARWMVSLSCKKRDAFFVTAIHDRLFQQNGDGLDLSALNIQRAREHGLPSYTKFRDFCGFPAASDFSDLPDHTSYFQMKLSEVYTSVDDIDLFVGAMTETSVADGNIGPTFACIMGHQFRDLKQGDRFWFERPLPEGLTQAQRNNVKSVSLSRIICQVFNLQIIQKNIFEVPRINELVPCSDLPDIDVQLWLH